MTLAKMDQRTKDKQVDNEVKKFRLQMFKLVGKQLATNFLYDTKQQFEFIFDLYKSLEVNWLATTFSQDDLIDNIMELVDTLQMKHFALSSKYRNAVEKLYLRFKYQSNVKKTSKNV